MKKTIKIFIGIIIVGILLGTALTIGIWNWSADSQSVTYSQISTTTPATTPETTSETTSPVTEAELSQTTVTVKTEPKYTVEAMNAKMWTNTGVYIRKTPDANGEKVILLSKGTEVQVTGKTSTNFYAVTANGKNGYILCDYITSSAPVAQTAPISNGNIKAFKVVMQNPELPTGCEITALTQTLNFYGFNVSKKSMADNYLYCSTNSVNTLDTCFIGSPYSNDSYGCNAPVIVKAANDFFKDKNSNYKAVNITGAEPSKLYEYIDSGTPVIVWATMGMVSTTKDFIWTTPNGEKVYFWRNEHCMTIIGYSASKVTIADPQKGTKEYDRKLFEQRYSQLGKQAIVISN